MAKRFTREELYDLIWSAPATALAKSLGVSDVALLKKCRSMQIPLPGRGHWAQVAAGKSSRRPKLPPWTQGTAMEAKFGLEEWEERRRKEREEFEEQIQGSSPTILSITVPTDLRAAHPLTRATRQGLESSKPDDYGRVLSTPGKGLLVNIGPESVRRALLIVDALVKAAEVAGVRFVYDDKKNELHAQCNGSYCEVKVLEDSHRQNLPADPKAKDKVPYSYRGYLYVPSGKLRIELEPGFITGRHSWKDGGRELESQLPEVIEGMFLLAKAHALWEEQRRIEHERYQSQARIRQQREEEAHEHEGAWKELLGEAQDWENQHLVERYLLSFEGTELTKFGQAWIKKARATLARHRAGPPEDADNEQVDDD